MTTMSRTRAFFPFARKGFFPLFFKAYWADPDYPSESTFYLGMANSIASIIVALFAPFLGAIPIELQVRKGGDDGKPLMGSNFDSPATVSFNKIADNLVKVLEESK